MNSTCDDRLTISGGQGSPGAFFTHGACSTVSLRLKCCSGSARAENPGRVRELVREFLLSQQNADGGFKDRTGRSDLYYTVFGLES